MLGGRAHWVSPFNIEELVTWVHVRESGKELECIKTTAPFGIVVQQPLKVFAIFIAWLQSLLRKLPVLAMEIENHALTVLMKALV